MRQARWTVTGLPILVGLLLLTGCVPAQQPAATQAASDFQSRVGTQDWSGACQLLSEGTARQLELTTNRACPEALEQLSLPRGPIGAVEVWGHNASGQIGEDGAVFLSRYADGWRVIAAGCRFRGEDLPYDCAVRS